jgi:GDPmannose 4,6-dehydratase
MEELVSSDSSGDFVFATGSLSSVRDVLSISAIAAGFEPLYAGEGIYEQCIDQGSGRILAQVNSKFFRSHDTFPNAGDATKLKNEIGWKPSRPLNEIVSEMVIADLKRL